MRKNLIGVLVLCLGMMIAASARAGLTAGVFGGYTLNTDEEMQDVENIEKGGLTFGAKAGFQLTMVTVGLMSGYLPIYSYDVETDSVIGTVAAKASMYSIPVLAFGQISAGEMFFFGGLGMHNLSASSETTIAGNTTKTSDSETRTGFMLGAGYSVPTPGVNVETSVMYHMIAAGEGDDQKAVNLITFSVGANFSL